MISHLDELPNGDGPANRPDHRSGRLRRLEQIFTGEVSILFALFFL
jgi:hypothetical protein